MITIAQVGVGIWGQNHTRVFSNINGCHLKVCCDKKKESLDKASAISHKSLLVTDNFDDIIQDKAIDGVVITTPAATHAELALRTLESGKHVFVEKPLALNLGDAKKMIESAHRNKKILMVGHLLLYHPAVKMLKSYIKDGSLGDIYYIYSTRVNLGQVRHEENVLWSLISHDISVALHLIEKKPVSVRAIGRSYIRKNIEDVAFVTIDFENNVVVHIHASWLDPHKMRKFTIVGSKKMAVFDDMESNEKIRIYDKGFDWEKKGTTYDTFLTLREGDVLIPRIEMAEPLKVECRHFIDCIKDNKQPITNGENGLEVLTILDAAQKSLEKNGEAVKV